MAGKMIVTDPVILPRHGIESFAGIEKNPIVELPFPAGNVIKDIDLVIISHLHQDHFDDGAKKMLPKNIPMYCQPGNKNAIKKNGKLSSEKSLVLFLKLTMNLLSTGPEIRFYMMKLKISSPLSNPILF